MSATSLTATTPAHAVGAVTVVVTNPDTQSGTLPGGYTFTGTSSVSGTVYYSTTPKVGIQVDLIQGSYSDPPLRTTYSDAAGHYEFLGLVDGTYWVKRIGPTGYSTGGITVTVTGAVTHDIYLPKLITLLSPPDQSTLATPHPTLTWPAIPEAVRYRVQINDTLQWWPTFESQDSLTASYTVQGALTPNRSYTWQVDAVDAGNHSVGTTQYAFRVTYVPAMTVAGVTPASGTTAGGTAVTISGTNFVSGATVTFGGTAATNVAFVSATSLTATTPAHAAGAVHVVVTNPDSQSATLTGGFTYTALAPTVTGVSPASGAIGSPVTLTGTHFTGTTAVTFTGVPAAFTEVSATQITTTVPVGTITGLVRVTTPGGTATSAGPFVVTNQSATRTLPACYVAGSALTVTLNLGPAPSVKVQALEDQPPENWTVGPISHSGAWDPVNLLVKWGLFFDAVARTITYEVTPPASAADPVTFAGVASFDGIEVVTGGATTLARCEAHPADSNADFQIVIEEVTAYGAAWKRGQVWPLPPNPIPIGYVTRAGYLWRVGEFYRRDNTQLCPSCWVSLSAVPLPVPAPVVLPEAPATRGGPWGEEPAEAGVVKIGAATREVPATYTPTGPLAVTIAVTPGGDTQAWAVEEVVPAGWRVSAVSHGGFWDEAAHTVRWGPFFDVAVQTLRYTLTPPAGTTGPHALRGTASFDGEDVPTAGRTVIQPAPQTGPGEPGR